MIKSLFLLIFAFWSFHSFGKCAESPSFIDSAITFEKSFKNVKSVKFKYDDGRNIDGKAEFVEVTSTTFFVRYELEFGMKGAYLFAVDLNEKKVFFASFMDGAAIPLSLVEGELDSDHCAIKFADSDASYTLTYGVKPTITFEMKNQNSEKVKIFFDY
ncbi:hypothetical protein [Alteromonas sp. RKMC-009]|uniref:hypothetical protein n=1 Tax=Alteromonas sp. RKMC-009 TaxID=2267264 RepID=UPI000E68969D|nr:hypothetical protein [Alteromonas sp. RKMC-009]AYA63452.1 hypothetical protein DS731_05245 [Alteromonas sp. RKMC-009]